MRSNPKSLVPLVVAGLLAGACSTKEGGAAASASHSAAPAGGASVFCAGVNSCSAKSECATEAHACAGKNTCKGEGILKMSAEDCRAKGGRVAPNRM